MTVALEAWRAIWRELGAKTVNGGLMNQLVAAYSERHRHYHTLQHLRECLANADAVRTLARQPAEVELALWFHDAVYDPRRTDNEDRSARWVHASVLAAGCDAAIAERVSALVMATAGHRVSEDSTHSCCSTSTCPSSGRRMRASTSTSGRCAWSTRTSTMRRSGRGG